jgi:hypothetical protein
VIFDSLTGNSNIGLVVVNNPSDDADNYEIHMRIITAEMLLNGSGTLDARSFEQDDIRGLLVCHVVHIHERMCSSSFVL